MAQFRLTTKRKPAIYILALELLEKNKIFNDDGLCNVIMYSICKLYNIDSNNKCFSFHLKKYNITIDSNNINNKYDSLDIYTLHYSDLWNDFYKYKTNHNIYWLNYNKEGAKLSSKKSYNNRKRVLKELIKTCQDKLNK